MEYSKFIGIPFKYGGRTLDGLDCWGLVIKFFSELGITVEDPIRYGAEVEGHDDLFDILRRADERRKEEWRIVKAPEKVGDLCFFKKTKRPLAQHVGIYVEGKKILHTSLKTGSIITPLRYFASKHTRTWRNKWLR